MVSAIIKSLIIGTRNFSPHNLLIDKIDYGKLNKLYLLICYNIIYMFLYRPREAVF